MNNDTYRKFASLSQEDQDSVLRYMDFLLSLEALEKDGRKQSDLQQASAVPG